MRESRDMFVESDIETSQNSNSVGCEHPDNVEVQIFLDENEALPSEPDYDFT